MFEWNAIAPATAVLSVALIIGLSAVGTALMMARRFRRRLAAQQRVLEEMRDDLRALCAGAVGLGERVARIERGSRRLKERQEQLELRDNGERLYAQAIRMVRKGADTDELIDVCGLSRGEAELVAMMHRMDAAS